MNISTPHNICIAESKQPGVSIIINMGYFQDPDECPGLAHLCEHLLMRGHAKTDGLDTKFSNISVANQATTDTNKVTFTWHCPESEISEIILSFVSYLSAFNICNNALDAEIKIISQEFSACYDDPIRRLQEVDKHTCNPHHPYTKFSTGNAQTFASISRERLIQYTKDWFAKAVQSLRFDCYIRPEQKAFATDLIRKVSHLDMPLMSLNTKEPKLFRPEDLNQFIHIDLPVTQPKFIMQCPIAPHVSRQSIDTLLWMINYAPANFVFPLLKNEGFITQYHAEYGDHIGEYQSIQLHLNLSMKGMLQKARVINVIFTTFSRIDIHQAPEMYWYQLQQTQEIFSQMHSLPSVDMIDTKTLSSDIEAILGQFKPELSRVLFICDSEQCSFIHGNISQTKYYKTRYQQTNLQFTATPNDHLCRDEALIFYFDNPLLHSDACGSELLTTNIMHSEKQFYAIHRNHPAKLVEIYFAFNYQATFDHQTQMSLALGVQRFNSQPNFIKDCAIALGCQIRLYTQRQGMTLHFRAPLAVATILTREIIRTLRTDITFSDASNIQWEQQKQDIYQQKKRSKALNIEAFALNQLAQCFSPNVNDKNDDLKNNETLTAADAEVLFDSFFNEATPEILIFGSYNQELINELFAMSKDKTNRLESNTKIEQNHTIPKNISHIFVPEQALLQSQHYSGLLLYSTSSDIEEHIDWMILAMLLQNSFFQFIRQQHQIAYDCQVSYITHRGLPGILLYAIHDQPHGTINSLFETFIEQCRAALTLEIVKSVIPQLKKSITIPQTEFSIEANYYWMMLGKPEGLAFNDKLIARCEYLEQLEEYELGKKLCLNTTSSVCIDVATHQES